MGIVWSKMFDMLYLTYPTMIEDARSSADTGAESRSSWPQPGELWSFRKLLQKFVAINLWRAGEASRDLMELYLESFWLEDREKDVESAKNRFEFLAEIMGLLGERAIGESLYKLAKEPPKDHELVHFVLEQCESALERQKFLIMPTYDAHLFGKAEGFGPEVAQAFPSSSLEIRDAGSCLALGQPTASVFHLMRALEPPLIALGKKFDVDVKENWNAALNDIEKAVRNRENPKNRPDWEAEQDFYTDAVTHFFHMKNAWRNYTMHLQLRFEADEARHIRQNVMYFMQKMATRLREQ